MASSAMDCLAESMREMMRYKPTDDVEHITKAYALQPEGDLSVLATAKNVVIEFNLQAEGEAEGDKATLDLTFGLLLSETLFAMPIKAVKIHNNPKDSLRHGLEPLPNVEAAENAALVVHMQSCFLEEEEDIDDESTCSDVVELMAAFEKAPEDEQAVLKDKLKQRKLANTLEGFEKWHRGRVAKLEAQMPGMLKLMQAMKASTSIESVYVRIFGENGCNSIPEKFLMVAFPRVISYWAFHPTMVSLDMSHCNLGGFGSFIVVVMLMKNQTIARFDITNSYKPRMGLERGMFEGDALSALKGKINLEELLEEMEMQQVAELLAAPQP